MKQQSCPRLHQKQSEDLNSKIFRGGRACPQTTLVGWHAYLCATCYYHPTTTLFPLPPNSKSSRYHPLPPNSKSSHYPPLPPPQLKIIPLPPSSPPTQNHPTTTLFPSNSKSSRYHPLSSSQLKILYGTLLTFQSFVEGERWPGLID